MSGLDIAEKRRPQDGKFQLKVEGRQIDFRVSTLPTTHGEKVVMRILDSSNLTLKLETLGFEEKALVDIQEAINVPYGMLLVTGPTGAGSRPPSTRRSGRSSRRRRTSSPSRTRWSTSWKA